MTSNFSSNFSCDYILSYDAAGNKVKERVINGVIVEYTNIDLNRRLDQLKVTVAGQELLNLRYTYDEVSNIKTITDGGKIKTFEYDKNNQLIKSVTPGIFMEPTPTPGTAALKVGDTLGNGVFEFAPILSGLMGLDYHASSIGIDFGSVAPGVKKIELVPDQEYSTHRINENTMALYISNDNMNYTLIPEANWEYQKDEKGIITLALKEKLATRYLKLHIKYDERGWNFEPVNKATFLNEIAKMLRVYQEATSRTEEYQYDKAGNRKLSRVTLVQTAELTSQYYTNTDRLKTDGRYAFAYDKAGNMVKKGNVFEISGDTVNFTTSGEGVEYWEYKYDLLNRLINVTKNGTIVAEYAYDPEGLRVVKKAKGETTHYVFQGTEPIFEKRINAGKTKSYVYALGKYLARVDGVIGDPDTKKYFYHTDHAGSIRVITDQAGEVVYKADYFAFGTQFVKDGDFEELHGFTGKEYDPDIGLYYFNARWYDPDLGRFISEDPAGQGPNPYSYCGNNPLNRVDPTGKVWWWLVSAIISGLDSYLCGGDFLQGFVMGAFTGAMGYGINAFVGQAWGATLGAVGTRVVSGAIAGGIMGEISGQGAIKGAVYGAVSGVISYEMDMRYGEFADKNWFNEALIGGLKGGFNALLRGGDFVEGFEYGVGGFLKDELTEAAGTIIYQGRMRWDIEGYCEIYYNREDQTMYWVDSKGQIIKSWECRDKFVEGYNEEGLPRASLPDGDYTAYAYEPGVDYGISYGTFYISTGDPRGRDIHGGGGGLSTKDTKETDYKNRTGSYHPNQPWVKTFGCMRMKNADGEALSHLMKGQGNVATLHVCTTIKIQDGWVMGYYQEGIGITRFTSGAF